MSVNCDTERDCDDIEHVYYDTNLGCYHNPSQIQNASEFELKAMKTIEKHDVRPCSQCYPKECTQYENRKARELLEKYAPPETSDTIGGGLQAAQKPSGWVNRFCMNSR